VEEQTRDDLNWYTRRLSRQLDKEMEEIRKIRRK
jgi:hypothetical protein